MWVSIFNTPDWSDSSSTIDSLKSLSRLWGDALLLSQSWLNCKMISWCCYLPLFEHYVNEWMTKTLSDNPARCGWRRCLRDPTVERPWWQPDQQVVISWRWCRQQQQSHHMVTAGPLSSTRVYGLDGWGRGGDTSYFSSYFLGYFSLV